MDEALALLDSSVAAAREVANPFWLTYALWIAGITLSKVDPPRALSAWEEGLAVVRDQGVRELIDIDSDLLLGLGKGIREQEELVLW